MQTSTPVVVRSKREQIRICAAAATCCSIPPHLLHTALRLVASCCARLDLDAVLHVYNARLMKCMLPCSREVCRAVCLLHKGDPAG